MKKILFFIFIFLLSIICIACNNNETKKEPEQSADSIFFETEKEPEQTANSNVTKTIESNNISNDSEHRTGPSVIKNLSFFDFKSFNNYFNTLNMNNYYFVSFDLDDSLCVGTKKYFYGTNQSIDNSIIEPENYSHTIKYEFYSNNNPIGSGIDDLSYKVECYDILLINNCIVPNLDFKLVGEKDTILIFDLLLNDEIVMKIKIDMEDNYTFDDVADIVLLLENNLIIIRGGK